MSLVFLKSENRETTRTANPHRPSRFSNYFTQPLHLEPNSQVALINTKFNLVGGNQLSDSGTLEVRNGDVALNQPIQLPLKDPYVTNWEAETNTIARAINQLGMDDNYNHAFVDSLVVPTIGGVSPTDINPQDEFNAGTNFFYVDGERKTYGRLVQRGINQMFMQGFNCLNTNPTAVWGTAGPNGYGLLTQGINFGSGDNRIDFNDNTEYDVTNVASFANAPTVYGADAIVRQPRHGGPAGSTTQTANFYHTQYSSTRLSRSAIDMGLSISDPPGPRNLGGVDNSEIAFDNYQRALDEPSIPLADKEKYWGYSFSSTRVGIKQYVGNQALNNVRELNGGGHDLPSNTDSGGYNIYVQDGIDFGIAQQNTPAAAVGAAYEGRVGLTAHCFGLNSCEFVYTAGGLVPDADNTSFNGRRTFIQNVDLNRSTSSTVPEGAFARYIIGVRYKWRGAAGSRRLVAQCEILDPEVGSMTISSYRNVGPELDIHELSQGNNTAVAGAPFNFGGSYDINVHGGANTEAFLVWRFRWTSPYQIAVEFCLSVDGLATSYNLETDEPYLPPSSSDPTRNWCKLYNMNVNDDGANGITYYIPNFHNGLIFVDYPTMGRDLQYNMTKGFYDTRLSNRLKQLSTAKKNALGDVIDLNTLQPYYNMHYWTKEDVDIWEYERMVTWKDNQAGNTPEKMLGITPEKFQTGTGLATKEIYWLVKPIRDLNDEQEWMSYDNDFEEIVAYQAGSPSPFTFGIEFGLVTNADAGVFEWNRDIAGIGSNYEIYGFNANHAILPGLASVSLHYQLTNLPVLSQNGPKATTNKTIYVIDALCLDDNNHTTSPQGWYCHEVPEKLWIDLNNIGPLDLNSLSMLITDDENREITNFGAGLATSVVLCFRQKPNNQGYAPYQGGTQVNQRFDPSHTFYQNTQKPM
mgnify:CR=1 FL=1